MTYRHRSRSRVRKLAQDRVTTPTFTAVASSLTPEQESAGQHGPDPVGVAGELGRVRARCGSRSLVELHRELEVPQSGARLAGIAREHRRSRGLKLGAHLVGLGRRQVEPSYDLVDQVIDLLTCPLHVN